MTIRDPLNRRFFLAASGVSAVVAVVAGSNVGFDWEIPLPASMRTAMRVGLPLLSVLLIWRQLLVRGVPARTREVAGRRDRVLVLGAALFGSSVVLGWIGLVAATHWRMGPEEALAAACEPYRMFADQCVSVESGGGQASEWCDGPMSRRESRYSGPIAFWMRPDACPQYPADLDSHWVDSNGYYGTAEVERTMLDRYRVVGSWFLLRGDVEMTSLPRFRAIAAWGVYVSIVLALFCGSFPFGTRRTLREHEVVARIKTVALSAAAIWGAWEVVHGWVIMAFYTRQFLEYMPTRLTLAVIVSSLLLVIYQLRRRRFRRHLHVAWPVVVLSACVLPLVALQYLFPVDSIWGQPAAGHVAASIAVILVLLPLFTAINERIRALPE